MLDIDRNNQKLIVQLLVEIRAANISKRVDKCVDVDIDMLMKLKISLHSMRVLTLQ